MIEIQEDVKLQGILNLTKMGENTLAAAVFLLTRVRLCRKATF